VLTSAASTALPGRRSFLPSFMPLAHGIDIVEVERIAQMLQRHGQRFLDRVYTSAEQSYILASRRRDEHLAARFAAKEAVLKALGTGWRSGIGWTDIEIVPLPSGQPTLRLHGRAAQIAQQQRLSDWSISLSHTSQYAVASAVAAEAPATLDAALTRAD
jgi:holo-[acyl-carrier protein] synthase